MFLYLNVNLKLIEKYTHTHTHTHTYALYVIIYIFYMYIISDWASLVVQSVKNLTAMQETWVQSLGPENPLEK